ncbi:Ferritin-like metal-binding protein YciE [Promicromonospora umidemergens]|uniref:Ferritin-like domain-containing protein n=1 Tax=Promicromonospora umidemergens TaxID=629679 RepID=A0ABP8XZT3_9MICO|nr:ferritin-like domain-containing protein [Promicromonospora umidemergens]MCP2284152.1 Ferritin-like metal-binding protein YciE [Promicromonospora umidemergens]
MTAREKVIDWLNDAHAMELALEEVLVRHAKDAEGDPEVQTRIEQHAEETRRQAQTVRGCIESLGGEVSGSKDTVAKMFGTMQGMANRPMHDTMVKNALADYAAEHFEIACYRALIDACDQIGAEDVAIRLTDILREEEAMARFLEQKLPGAVRSALADAM